MRRRGFVLPAALLLCAALAGALLAALGALRERELRAAREFAAAELKWAAVAALRQVAPEVRALLPSEPTEDPPSAAFLLLPLPPQQRGDLRITFLLRHTAYSGAPKEDFPPQILPPQAWGTVIAEKNGVVYRLPCRVTADGTDLLP